MAASTIDKIARRGKARPWDGRLPDRDWLPGSTRRPIRAAERRLKESEEKYRRILEETNDAFFEVDLDGRITFCNHAFCDLVGYPMEQIAGMDAWRFIDEGNLSGVADMFARVYQTGQPAKAVYYVLTRRDGSVLHLDTSASVKSDGDGKPMGIRGVVKDISHRKQIEAELIRHRDNLQGLVDERTSQLRHSKVILQTILDSMPYGVVIVGVDKLIRYANQLALALMGYDNQAEVKGRICHATLSATPHDQCPVVDLGRVMDRCEWALKTKGGQTIPILKSVIQLELDDEPVLLETFIDITERKRAEEALLQSKIEADAGNIANSQFLANMSHEIRTPLNGILGMAELAMETPLSADQRRIIETIEKESTHLLEMINTVLDFSKIEAGKFQLDRIPFDLRLLIEDVASSIALRARDHGLEFASFASPTIPERLVGDPGRLRQVLNNLAGNALKFTETGEIVIRAKTTEHAGDRVKVHFEVSDTGIGIPLDRQEAIFENFTQADGSTTRKFGGTGLGTTIAKHLVELMGGEIGLTSEPGKGSRFWFTALFDHAPEEQTTLQPNQQGMAGLKVLVVDDNQCARQIIVEYLTLFGCEVAESPSSVPVPGLLESAAAASRPFDLLVSDIRMPEMDGFELATAIRTNDTLKEMAIILLSGVSAIGDGDRCRHIGIDGYLNKPVKMAELELAIRLIYGSDKAAGPSSRTLVTRHTIAENHARPQRILLVEDYPTNQLVASNHLRNAGLMVDLAENGREAVEAFERHAYRLILMDMQMPVMDGYKATGIIRGIEDARQTSGSGPSPRIPIVAMTANALKGDRERCLAAGADDYITKPLKKGKLLAAVSQWITVPDRPVAPATAPTPVTPAEATAAPMNYVQALEEFDDDPAFLNEVMRGFIENATAQIGTLRQAVLTGAAEVVARDAHSIKGGAANLTADALSGAAARLEAAGKAGALSPAKELIDNLEAELRRLDAFAGTLAEPSVIGHG